MSGRGGRERERDCSAFDLLFALYLLSYICVCVCVCNNNAFRYMRLFIFTPHWVARWRHFATCKAKVCFYSTSLPLSLSTFANCISYIFAWHICFGSIQLELRRVNCLKPICIYIYFTWFIRCQHFEVNFNFLWLPIKDNIWEREGEWGKNVKINSIKELIEKSMQCLK